MFNPPQIDARVVHNPEVFGGKPIIKGTRMPVDLIVDFNQNGVSVEQIVEDYPELTREDIEAALAFAKREAARTEVRTW